MRRLIVNADDFGLCHSVNLGILQAFRQGIVTSATLMVNQTGASEAFALAQQNPGLGVGVHITLTAGRPVADGVTSLTGPDGRFLRLPALAQAAAADPGAVRREVRAQVEAFLAAGRSPTHLDSHHHVHQEVPVVGAAVAEAAARLGIPVRGREAALITEFYGREAVSSERLLALLQNLPEGLSEIMCHPARTDDELLRISSYAAERKVELRTLTDPAVLRAVRELGIELVKYRPLCP